jgi:hypothetical protein
MRRSVELYQGIKRHELLLDDFLEQQLSGLPEWRPEVVGSCLALDLLAYPTTPVGTAETRVAAEVVERCGRRLLTNVAQSPRCASRPPLQHIQCPRSRFPCNGQRDSVLLPNCGSLMPHIFVQ